ncbi:MAG: hypothetical protein IIU57_01550 [Oscillospiraceae bacterium]|nr:hypothetical protein [Oscillospiraceae bacterium]
MKNKKRPCSKMSTVFLKNGGIMDEKDFEYYLKKIAPSQKEFRSEAARKGERIAPFWMPDDIGTEGFGKNSGTLYLRKME